MDLHEDEAIRDALLGAIWLADLGALDKLVLVAFAFGARRSGREFAVTASALCRATNASWPEVSARLRLLESRGILDRQANGRWIIRLKSVQRPPFVDADGTVDERDPRRAAIWFAFMEGGQA